MRVVFLLPRTKMGIAIVNDIVRYYDNLASSYDEKYVSGGLDNPYMRDEFAARQHFIDAGLIGRGPIISLGSGTGQDVEIICFPHHEKYVGFDVSPEMTNRAREKFPGYRFQLHDCTKPIELEEHNISFKPYTLVCMFGAANYLGIDKLLEHYCHLKFRAAFFVFYNENYQDGIADDYHVYNKKQLTERFSQYPATVVPLFNGSNYNVVNWNEDSSL